MQVQLAFDVLLLKHFRLFRAWRQQQRLDVCLRQLALGVERHLPQQPPATRQGDGFAMRLQVVSQGFGERPTALVAQGQQARVAQHRERAQRGTVCLHHTKARFTHPFVSRKGLLDQRQGHALLFEFDDAVEPAQQFKAPICTDQRSVCGLLDMAGRQIGRADAQRTLRILTQLYAVEGLPALPALTPGDAAGFELPRISVGH